MSATSLRSAIAASAGAIVLGLSGSTASAQETTQGETLSIEQFVLGNMLFLAYHEAAHVLIEDLEVPITGWPEDSADNLATLMMTPDEGDSESNVLAASAALGWLQDARTAEAAGHRPNFADVHALSEARATRIVCLLAGSEIESDSQGRFFGELAKARGGTENYLKQCANQARLIYSGWASALGEHFLGEGDEPSAEIEVRYDAPPPGLEQAHAYMQSNGVLDIVGADVRDMVHGVQPFTLVARSCNSPDAFWSPSKREAVICYELANWFITNAPK